MADLFRHEYAVWRRSQQQVQMDTGKPVQQALNPIIIIGSTLLRDIIIVDEGKTRSINLSDETQRLFGSSIAQNIATLETNCVKGFNLDYFRNVQAKLTGMKDFRGLLILETDIQTTITSTTSTFQLIQLAKSYVIQLRNLPSLPKHVIIVGAINSMAAFMSMRGPKITWFNTTLRYLAAHYGWGFLDPCDWYVNYRCTDNPANTIKCLPSKMFTRDGEKTKQGHQHVLNQLSDLYRTAKRVAKLVGHPINLVSQV